MANFTLQEITEMVNDDRGETSQAFASSDRIKRYLNRYVKMILKRPGVQTVRAEQIISFDGGSQYTLNDDVHRVIELISGGEGETGSIRFDYYPPDEFSRIIFGYAWTIRTPGFIDIIATSPNALPTTDLTLRYWSTNIILNHGTDPTGNWDADDDTSGLDGGYDVGYISYATAMIKRREGSFKESDECMKEALQVIEDIVMGGNGPKPDRRNSWGHWKR